MSRRPLPRAGWFRYLSLVAMLVAVHAPARAQQAGDAFAWQAPVSCPPADEVRRRLAELEVGDFQDGQRQVQVVIEEQEGVGFRLLLRTTLDGRSGERELSGPSCDEVTDAAIAMLAVLLDAEARRAEALPEPEPEPAPEAPPAQRAKPAPVARVPSPRRIPPAAPALDGVLFAGVGSGVGFLPGVALAFDARIAVRRGPWSLHLAGQLWPQRVAPSPDLAGAGAELALFAVGVQGCREQPVGRVGLRFCGGLDAGWTRAHGFGVDERRAPLVYGSSVVAGFGLAFAISRSFRVRGLVEGNLPLARPRFVLSNVGAVYRRPFLGGRAVFGPELVF